MLLNMLATISAEFLDEGPIPVGPWSPAHMVRFIFVDGNQKICNLFTAVRVLITTY